MKAALSLRTKRALFRAISLYAFAVWAWAAANVLDPITAPGQAGPLSVYIPVPLNLAGDIAFLISFLFFFLLQRIPRD